LKQSGLRTSFRNRPDEVRVEKQKAWKKPTPEEEIETIQNEIKGSGPRAATQKRL